MKDMGTRMYVTASVLVSRMGYRMKIRITYLRESVCAFVEDWKRERERCGESMR